MYTASLNTRSNARKKMKSLKKVTFIYCVVSTVLIVSKMLGFLDIRWTWALSPIWGLAVVTFIAVGFIFAVASITAAVDKFLDRDVSIPLKKWAYS